MPRLYTWSKSSRVVGVTVKHYNTMTIHMTSKYFLDRIVELFFMIQEETLQPRMFKDQMPPLAFPFGYMIISSTFMYYEDEEDEDGNKKS